MSYDSSAGNFDALPEKHSLTVTASRKYPFLILFAALFAVVLGLVLELYIYKKFAFQLRDVPFLLNGWFLVVLGTVFLWMGFTMIRQDPVLLMVDSTGIFSPRQQLMIEWNDIEDVRIPTNEEGDSVGRCIAVRVKDRNQIVNADAFRPDQLKLLEEYFEEDEIPFGLHFGSHTPEDVLKRLKSYLSED